MMRRPSLWEEQLFVRVFILVLYLIVMSFGWISALTFPLGVGDVSYPVALSVLTSFLLFIILYRLSHQRGRRWFVRSDEAFFRGWIRCHPAGPSAALPRFCSDCGEKLAFNWAYCPHCGHGPFERQEGAAPDEGAVRIIPFEQCFIQLPLVAYLGFLLIPAYQAGVWLFAPVPILMAVALIGAIHGLSYAMGKGWFVRYDEKFILGWVRRARKEKMAEGDSSPCAACGGSVQAQHRHCPHCGVRRQGVE